MTKAEELIELVVEELNNIKKFATPEEIDNLRNVQEINPLNMRRCIYGIMTGHCDGDRSIALINQCSSVRINNTHNLKNREGTEEMIEITKDKRDDIASNFSPLETFLWFATDAEISNVVCYLRSRDNTTPITFNINEWVYRGDEESFVVPITCSRD